MVRAGNAIGVKKASVEPVSVDGYLQVVKRLWRKQQVEEEEGENW